MTRSMKCFLPPRVRRQPRRRVHKARGDSLRQRVCPAQWAGAVHDNPEFVGTAPFDADPCVDVLFDLAAEVPETGLFGGRCRIKRPVTDRIAMPHRCVAGTQVRGRKPSRRQRRAPSGRVDRSPSNPRIVRRCLMAARRFLQCAGSAVLVPSLSLLLSSCLLFLVTKSPIVVRRLHHYRQHSCGDQGDGPN